MSSRYPRTVGAGFGGDLASGQPCSRPFPSGVFGRALCLSRLGRAEEAAAVAQRLLGLDPGDNQGAGMMPDDVGAGRAWPGP